MGFFGTDGINEGLNSIIKKKTTAQVFLDSISSAELGDCIIYNKILKRFVIIKPSVTISESSDIPIGIVLSQDSNREITVLIKSFLSENAIRIPISYIDKQQYLPAYIKNIYERYTTKFKKESPEIKKIKKLKLHIIQAEYIPQIFSLRDSFQKLLGQEKTNKFFNKLKTTRIYTNYKGKLQMWSYNNTGNVIIDINNELQDISIIGGNFLVTTKIKIV